LSAAACSSEAGGRGGERRAGGEVVREARALVGRDGARRAARMPEPCAYALARSPVLPPARPEHMCIIACASAAAACGASAAWMVPLASCHHTPAAAGVVCAVLAQTSAASAAATTRACAAAARAFSSTSIRCLAAATARTASACACTAAAAACAVSARASVSSRAASSARARDAASALPAAGADGDAPQEEPLAARLCAARCAWDGVAVALVRGRGRGCTWGCSLEHTWACSLGGTVRGCSGSVRAVRRASSATQCAPT